MSASRAGRSHRSLTFISALLLSTAIAAPAFAQIEEVVVTAQKKSEDIQTVPISVTAYTAEDLKAHQITKFSDLQFATPNVTYSQANFGGANFQIRGIGITAVGHDSESGIAIDFNNVFLAAPPTDGAEFYDLQDLEVLRGPQSTLYGRGATGGVVNIMPVRPDLTEASAQLDATYGNYDATEVKGDVNLPIITDELGVRIAGDFLKHDGFVTNIYNNSHVDGRDQYSVRGSLRWQPSDKTTIDIVGQIGTEDDNRMRADKELCAPDPTGTLGCTPATLTTGALNLNATYLNILASKQGAISSFAPGFASSLMFALLPPVVTSSSEFQNFYNAAYPNSAACPACVGGGNVPALLAGLTGPFTAAIQGAYGFGYATGQGIGNGVGLIDESAPFSPLPNSNPSNLRQLNTDITPFTKGNDNFLSGEWKQTWSSWLDMDMVLGLDNNSGSTGQSYTDTLGPPFGAVNLATAEGTFLAVLANPALGGSPSLAAKYAPFFAVPGELPMSAFTGLGISSGSITKYDSSETSDDLAYGSSHQYSGEVRFNTKFEGPINAMVGLYYLHQDSNTGYEVASNSLDYAGILLGGVTTLLTPALGGICGATGCLLGPTFYHNEGFNSLTSKAAFGEIYYDAIPDTLKFTLGVRFTDDVKDQGVRIAVLSLPLPIGASNEDGTIAGVAGAIGSTAFSSTPGQAFEYQKAQYDKWTGRLVADWTPKLDFTDQTLVYASYARGYKAGGFNPGVQSGISDLAQTYKPESIDAFELGTKNNALGGTLQANADIWYYNYSDLQVSSIIDNTSINENINAKLWGAEGEFVWLPTEKLQFNLNAAWTHSGIGNTPQVDQRNPASNDPKAILIKDDTYGQSANQNCVIYDNNPGPVTLPAGYTFTPGSAGPILAQYVAPPGGQHALASSGVANVAFGSCSTSPELANFLAAQGYTESNPADGGTFTGVPVNLQNNALQQTPDVTLSVGAQYTQPIDGGYNVVARVDYYWQSHMWGRIFEDPADLIKAWDVMNAQITLNAPDDRWYVGAFVKNIFNKTSVTGEYLTSSSSGLYTNAFLGDPRMYGIELGVRM